jgi:hypothetical protein
MNIAGYSFRQGQPDGMIRCCKGADKVVGFGRRLVKALIPPPLEGPDSESARPGPRIYPLCLPETTSGSIDDEVPPRIG